MTIIDRIWEEIDELRCLNREPKRLYVSPELKREIIIQSQAYGKGEYKFEGKKESIEGYRFLQLSDIQNILK